MSDTAMARDTIHPISPTDFEKPAIKAASSETTNQVK